MSAWSKANGVGGLFESRTSALRRTGAEAGVENFWLDAAERVGDDVDLIFTADGDRYLAELAAQQEKVRAQFGFGYFVSTHQEGRRYILTYSDSHPKTRYLAGKREAQDAKEEQHRLNDAEARLSRERDHERNQLQGQADTLQAHCTRLTQERDAAHTKLAAALQALVTEREQRKREMAQLRQSFEDELAKYPRHEIVRVGGASGWDRRVFHSDLPDGSWLSFGIPGGS